MTAMAEPEVPDCITCGRCCFTVNEDYIELDEDDWERLDERARALVSEVVDGPWLPEDPENSAAPPGWVAWAAAQPTRLRRFMRLEDGHCAALSLDAAKGLYLCSIYEQRPYVCRHALMPGWKHCHDQRRDKELVAIEALRRSARKIAASSS
jgi:uncharacterized protein